jgi:hypothetical protein
MNVLNLKPNLLDLTLLGTIEMNQPLKNPQTLPLLH